MSHLLSSSLKMQPTSPTQIEYSFELGSIGEMTIYYNGEYTYLNSTTSLTIDTLIPSVQNIDVTVTDEGTPPPPVYSNIDYYLNNIYVTSYSGTVSASTPSILTSAGNTYKFLGFSGLVN